MARFHLFRLSLGVATALSVACGGDSGPGPAPVPVRLGVAVEPSASAASGVPLQVQPVLQVVDASGEPVASRGLLVTVSLASGGGTLSGGANTRTDPAGRAAFTDLVLAGPAGPRTLRFSASGLSSAISREIAVGAGAATVAVVVAGNNQTLPAGTAVAVKPAVRVADASDNPVSGVAVVFSVTAGGGSIAGGATTTGADGIATLERWTLGTVAGANALSVTVGGLATPLVVTATGIVGPAATLERLDGDGQTGAIGSPLPIGPAVKVTDAFGNVLAGVAVTFAASDGGTGGSAVTDATGTARLAAWRLGLAAGPQTLVASRDLATVTFSATGLGYAASAVAAGSAHSCAVTATGASCWGNNNFGQLGRGNQQSDSLARPVLSSLVFQQVATGFGHSCGLTAGGQAWCWGQNTVGQLGDGTLTSRTAPVAVGGAATFTRVATGTGHTCGLKADGSLFCWGLGSNGQLGTGSTLSSLQPVAVVGGNLFSAVAAGDAHSCGLRSDGVVLCWGRNVDGRLGDGTTLDHASPAPVAGSAAYTAIVAGLSHTCALDGGGNAYCWGGGTFGQLGVGSPLPDSATTPRAVAGGHRFTALAAGAGHTCGLTAEGEAWCWGINSRGQLGDGTTLQRNTPVAVKAGVPLGAISAGTEHSCAVTVAGNAVCWGRNIEFQLGDGSRVNRLLPAGVRAP
jgi:alpha-tubulin suppressor-like RCC1 family protein